MRFLTYQSFTKSSQTFRNPAIPLLGIYPRNNSAPTKYHKYGRKLSTRHLFPFFWQQQLGCSGELSAHPLSLCFGAEMTPPLTLKKSVWSRPSQSHTAWHLPDQSNQCRRSEKSQGGKPDPIRAHPEIFVSGLQKTNSLSFPERTESRYCWYPIATACLRTQHRGSLHRQVTRQIP